MGTLCSVPNLNSFLDSEELLLPPFDEEDSDYELSRRPTTLCAKKHAENLTFRTQSSSEFILLVKIFILKRLNPNNTKD